MDSIFYAVFGEEALVAYLWIAKYIDRMLLFHSLPEVRSFAIPQEAMWKERKNKNKQEKGKESLVKWEVAAFDAWDPAISFSHSKMELGSRTFNILLEDSIRFISPEDKCRNL